MGEVVVTPVGRGVYRVTEGDRSRLAYAVATQDGTWVFVDGRIHLVESGDAAGLPVTASDVAQRSRAARRKRSDSAADLSAPMPATVRRITVEPGQRVSTGDVLIVLEAMKMELPIKAPRDATVASIACREGELVQPGVPLLELS